MRFLITFSKIYFSDSHILKFSYDLVPDLHFFM